MQASENLLHTSEHSSQHWQDELRNAISSGSALLEFLGLRADQVGFSDQACADFPLKVPRSFARRMRRGDPKDPLLLQVLATHSEIPDTPGFISDPVGELGETNPEPGIIHKYHGRALLIVSGGCAINCRYCFRRDFPYSDNANSRHEWAQALNYVRTDTTITEVILSGGDPLVIKDGPLRELVGLIGDFEHVKRLRIHSRLPIAIPSRVTGQFLNAISHTALQSVMVIHCNHAQELDETVIAALAKLRDHGITVLNQAVLLAGINDTVEAQVALNEKLFHAGVMPYYLHLLDKVRGAAHFDVPDNRAKSLMAQVAARLPGYMVPKLVRDIAGAQAKTAI